MDEEPVLWLGKKSKNFNSIGESQKWAEVIVNALFCVVHRHVVFTIDEGLRDIFLIEDCREALLKGLMDESARIVLEFFWKA